MNGDKQFVIPLETKMATM